MILAQAIVLICKIWLAAGALVALWFIGWAIDRIDPSARGAYAFRPLLAPGVILLWPFVIWRWRQLARTNRIGDH